MIDRARGAGLTQALTILAAGDAEEAARATRVAALWDAVRFAVGVHPHQAHEFGDSGRSSAIVRAAFADNLRAARSARSASTTTTTSRRATSSRRCSRRRCRSRASCGAPWSSTRARPTTTRSPSCARRGGEITGVFHCFTGDAALARRGLDLGFYVSLAGIVTFPKAGSLREAAALVPVDRLLAETDSPFLAPVPHRGQRNEPAWVCHVVDALARVRGTTAADIDARITANFLGLMRDA